MKKETKQKIDDLWKEYTELSKKEKEFKGVITEVPKEEANEVIDNMLRVRSIFLKIYELRYNEGIVSNAMPPGLIARVMQSIQNLEKVREVINTYM
jgi:hypothetical protein